LCYEYRKIEENQSKHELRRLTEMRKFLPYKASAGHDKESVMGPTISVCRKGKDVYLTLAGNFQTTSSQQMLQALRQLVMTMLKCTAPESPVAYSFKTHGKVNLGKTG
jgi:hypothetical protein